MNSEYFNYLCSLIDHPVMNKHSYVKLLQHLGDVEFRYILPLDENRTLDGLELRNEYRDRYGETGLGLRPCTVFEMMVALAVRCEVHIMSNTEIGDRTGKWFWDMISSLGLYSMYDSKYDPDKVNDILETFMDRKYQPNGRGGLFTVDEYAEYDLTTIEIWYQLNWYLKNIDE